MIYGKPKLKLRVEGNLASLKITPKIFRTKTKKTHGHCPSGIVCLVVSDHMSSHVSDLVS